jgi:3-methyladenine DNA glycosylase Tag
MEGPTQIRPKGLADYLDVLSKAVFQSGMSWRVVEAKWEGTREAFRGFDPHKVANLTPKQIDALAEDTRLIRNRRKIEATVENAETMLALDDEFGGFRKYLRSFEDFEALSADLVKRFKFLGDTGSYYFLHVVGEPVPPHEQWMKSHRPHGFVPRTSKARTAKAGTSKARTAKAGTSKARTAKAGTSKARTSKPRTRR